MIELTLTVEGRVQGVGFRARCVELACPFAIVGWVRNELDGRVTILAQGDSTEIDAFQDRLVLRLEDCPPVRVDRWNPVRRPISATTFDGFRITTSPDA